MASIDPLSSEQETVAAAVAISAPESETNSVLPSNPIHGEDNDGEGEISDVLTNLARPRTSATLTVRVIKSFAFRAEKSLVLHEVNLERTTVGALKAKAREAIKTQPGWRPYRALVDTDDADNRLDTLKLYTKAHGAKSTNLIINLEHDEDWIFDDDDAVLTDIGFENETEVSFFNRKQYEAFKVDPVTRWDTMDAARATS